MRSWMIYFARLTGLIFSLPIVGLLTVELSIAGEHLVLTAQSNASIGAVMSTCRSAALRCKSRNIKKAADDCGACRQYIDLGCEKRQKMPSESNRMMAKYIQKHNQPFLDKLDQCRNQPAQANRHKPVPVTNNPGQCTKLERSARFKSEELRKTRARWDGIEDDYLAFYDASKVSMQADFDKVYYELPNLMPFSGSINSMVKVETNVRLRHMPSIKIKRVPDSLARFQAFLTIASDLSGLIPGLSLLAEADTVNDWLTFWADKKLEKEMPYDEGVAKFRQIMKERQVTLDNYRRFINQFFCKKLVKLEHEIFIMRKKTVPQSQCAPNVKEAMDGWLARHTVFNNEIRLQSMDKYCASL